MFKKFLCVIFVLLLTTACSITHDLTQPKIIPPSNSSNPLYGVWTIKEIINNDSQSNNEEKLTVGEKVEFSPEHLLFKDAVLTAPTYKIKRVDLREYTLYNQTDFLLNYIDNNSVEIVTILEQGLFFCEVFLLNQEEIILSISTQTYHLVKETDKRTDNLEEMKSYADDKPTNTVNIDDTPTGVLLGLKQDKQNDYTYRTLWISKKGDKVEFAEIDDILFPRRSGFWKLKVIENQIYMFSTTNEEYNVLFSREMKNTEKERIIHYVGNDYVSLEEKYIERDEISAALKIVPVDSLPDTTGVSAMDLLGISGVEAITNSKEMVVSKIEQVPENVVLKQQPHENFGLARNMGQWVLMGNVAYKNDDNLLLEPYKINIIPPEELIKYNLFHLPWSHIKDRIPTATDAFTSPDINMAVITTPSEILVYEIINNRLSKEPLAVTKLDGYETVIMAEWATGLYVSSWEQEVKRELNKMD